MLASTSIWAGTVGTVVLWVASGSLAMLFGLLLAAGSLSMYRPVRLLARIGVNVTRGVPTSLLVIAAGIGMMRLARAPALPVVFPGTPVGFQHVALGVMVALALGSAGHLAEIFRAARAALGRFRLDQATVLGLSRRRRRLVLSREAAAIALPPTGARLVHHLHNTAFAALFPVTEVFGAVQGQASATFRVLPWALLGCLIYVTLGGCAWLLCRICEAWLTPATATTPFRRAVPWSSVS